MRRVLITGGAGFIGTALARRLLRGGDEVAILDNFNPQVHGEKTDLPPDLAGAVRLFRGDVRNADDLALALGGQDAVVHLAAETGTGQSMYEVRRYADVNVGGTASLLDHVMSRRFPRLATLIVASSRAVYGEGAYQCPEHDLVYPGPRRAEDIAAGRFEPRCPRCGVDCASVPTSETAPFQPSSVYGLTKQSQEQMVMLLAPTQGITTLALRYQNVFGPGQSLANPYTGILAIFSNLARAHHPIEIFEDGRPSRDFVYLDDVTAATAAALDRRGEAAVVNVGSGRSVSVREVAEGIVDFFGSRSEIRITGQCRQGDIRHNQADLTRARAVLGYEPGWTFAAGLERFLLWAQQQAVAGDGYQRSLQELRQRGLLHA